MDKEIREKIGEILTEYLARTTEVNQFGLQEKLVGLFFSQRQSILDEVKEKVEGMNNFRQAKVDGKDDWNDALEQAASKVDALIKSLSQEK